MSEIDKKLKERIRKKDFNRPLDEETVEAVTGTRMKVYCKTCRIVFLDIPVEDYNRLHSLEGNENGQVDDKWFIETAIHWFECQDPSHEIVQDTEVTQLSISDIWRQKYNEEIIRGRKQLGEKKKEEALKRIMEYLYNHRERVKDRPI